MKRYQDTLHCYTYVHWVGKDQTFVGLLITAKSGSGIRDHVLHHPVHFSFEQKLIF